MQYAKQDVVSYGKVQTFYSKVVKVNTLYLYIHRLLTSYKNIYLFQKVDNCLTLMCDVMKVYCHPALFHDSLVIADEIEEIEADSITGIITAQLNFKEIDGQIHILTQEVYYTVHTFIYSFQRY